MGLALWGWTVALTTAAEGDTMLADRRKRRGGWWGAAMLLLVSGCFGGADLAPGHVDSIPPTMVCSDLNDPSSCRPCSDCVLATPARIRRLTHAELDASASVLLGTSLRLSEGLPNEYRSEGFTRNDAQVVDTAYAQALDQAAARLTNELSGSRLATLVACAGAQDEGCARQFIERFTTDAFRRPSTPEENSALFEMYSAGLEEGGFTSGIQWVVRTVLQSPSFLYLTELGAPGTVGRTRLLTQREIAASLSFLVSGGPPDAELNAAAADQTLLDPMVRRAHALRLFNKRSSQVQLETLVLEWLGIDRLMALDKNGELYPGFAELRPAMLNEARAMVTDTFITQSGKIGDLLRRNTSFASEPLSSLYGVGLSNMTSGMGQMSWAQTPRRGILSTSAFLSTYSNPADSGPIRRGVAVLRRVLCQNIPNPSELNIEIVPPPARSDITTRERFDQHVTNPSCQTCHRTIDAIGFAFEHFDAVGKVRSQENGLAITTDGTLSLGSITGSFNGSTELVERIAASPELQSCFAQQVFRFASARHDPEDEAAFLKTWAGLSESARTSPREILLSYVQSTGFIARRVP